MDMVRAVGLALILVLAVSSGASAQVQRNIVESTLWEYEQVVGQALGQEAARCLSADSARWNTALFTTCRSDACFNAAYADRLSSLLVFLPEAEPVEGLDFVTTPQLVAIVAPEAETAEPADDFAAPEFEVQGTLVHASADKKHMGLAVQTGGGPAMVIVPDMDIGNQPSHALLQSLIADEPEQQFLVVGGVAETENALDFKTNHCRFIYRMPIPDN
jgi:hypothetical protein